VRPTREADVRDMRASNLFFRQLLLQLTLLNPTVNILRPRSDAQQTKSRRRSVMIGESDSQWTCVAADTQQETCVLQASHALSRSFDYGAGSRMRLAPPQTIAKGAKVLMCRSEANASERCFLIFCMRKPQVPKIARRLPRGLSAAPDVHQRAGGKKVPLENL
jgi:hypothetical protein